jgi:hypothetical protein
LDWDPAKAEHHENDETVADVWAPAPGMLVTRARGVGTLLAIRWYTARADRFLMRGDKLVSVFHHWAEITSFEPEARSYLRGWATERASSLGEAHYLVSSRLLAMAISAAALALGRALSAHTDPKRFERLLDERIVQLTIDRGKAR